MEKQRRIKMLSLSAVLVAVLGLTVAFAALSTTLNIKGSAYLDAAKWGIKFQNLSEPSIVGEASDAKTAKIEKDVSINDIKVALSKPGDSVTYTVDLVNDGDINAKIENIEKTNLTEEQQKYITFTVKYKENDTELKIGDILSKKEVKPLVIKIEYRKDLESSDLPKSAQGINLSYKLDFVQTDDKAVTTSGISKACTTFEKKDTYRVGDVIVLCNNDTKVSEDFYVISDNGSTVTALAKYNLLVGNVVKWNDDFSDVETTTPISSSEKGYGLQNEEVANYILDEQAGTINTTTIKGVLSFANKVEGNLYGYWIEKSGAFSSKYSGELQGDNNVFDENSLLYTPAKNYETYLKDILKKSSVTTNLITRGQLEKLGCDFNAQTCNSLPWVTNRGYWTGTVQLYTSVWGMLANVNIAQEEYTSNGLYGLRPVITISKSEL